MKLIRNISKAEIQFIGGNLLPDEEKSFPDSIADRVLRRNPTRIVLVGVAEESSENSETVEAVEVVEEEKPVKQVFKDRKKRK